MPLVSWAALKGRCRTCGRAIAAEHNVMEIGAALIGGFALLMHPGVGGLVTAVFGWWLLLLAAIDAKYHWLPDRLTLPLIPLGLAAAAAEVGPEIGSRAIGALVGFAVLAGIGWLYQRLRHREGLGGGDPKLLAGLGAWLGWMQLPFVLLGAGLLGLATLVLRRLRGESVSATDRLPLGTLLALAAWPLWLLLVTEAS